MKKLVVLVCFYLLFCNNIFGQDAQPNAYQDSLQTIIQENTSSRKAKQEALFLLGEHLVQRHPKKAQEIAEKLQNNYIGKTDSLTIRRNNYIFAASHRWQGDYKTALEYYKNIYQYSKHHNDSLNIAKSAHYIGTISMFLGNNVFSQQHLLKAVSIYEKLGTAKQKARINNTLAGFYLNINQFKKGKEKYLVALRQFKILNDSTGMASVNANLGMVYIELGEFDKAEKHLLKQKELNKVFPTLREMGFHHDFLGILRQKQGRLNEAYKEHLKALKIRENLSSTYNLCESKLNMGKILIKLKKYPEAIKQLKDVFKFDEHESLNQQQKAYQLLAEAYEKSGNYPTALKEFKAYKKMSDSIFSKDSMEIIAEKEAQYEQQKKDAEIALLSKEKELSEVRLARLRAIQIGSLLGFVFFLIIALLLFWLYKKLQTKNKIITKTLEERGLLLHETHHRVKNNLQMISSLLNLQSKYVEDKKAFEVLQNGRNRVESMAILHKNLYTGDKLDMITLQVYFKDLVSSVLNSCSKVENEINVTINANAIFMNIEQVVPIGLIANELITNSLKHAFSKKAIQKPEISIVMTQTKSEYILTIKDNGIGIKNNFLQEKSESFGHRLINSLTKKLKATTQINVKNGTSVTITIPKKELEK